jgi:2-C-methyl-D-erythritol 4-phosphate cytidylyltransferase / 2-C-methyl-D-erythritol 2,4-cyclodiphosphate synthase
LRTVALVVAAGRGERAAGAGNGPKQYARVCGRPVLAWSLAVFARHPRIDAIQVVIHPDDSSLYAGLIEGIDPEKLYRPVLGGSNRQASVLAGLEALDGRGFDAVLIHDAARPHLDGAGIDTLLDAIGGCSGAILALEVADTLKRSREDNVVGTRARIAETVPREGLWRALTPQAFRFSEILQAHRLAANAEAPAFTDDASVAEFAGLQVALVPGRPDNIKITTAEDFALSEMLLRGPCPDVRTGHGFDVHRFGAGDSVWLCGVAVPHTSRLVGHSDADVGLHALTDAVLGALGEGDIGSHFPPSDPQWKGASSLLFLEHAVGLAERAGAVLTHLDVTLICEAPKIGPHRSAMRARIAEIAGVEVGRVAVKATTTEGLGFTGRGEGIAAMATATAVFADRPS